MHLIDTARKLARRAHAGQTRKDGVTPYIEHPLAVAATLSGYGYDDETVAAGLLHDVIEDTDVNVAELDAAVGTRVRELVEAASEPDKSLSWRERKTATLAHLPTQELAAQRVIAADKLDNVRSIGEPISPFSRPSFSGAKLQQTVRCRAVRRRLYLGHGWYSARPCFQQYRRV